MATITGTSGNDSVTTAATSAGVTGGPATATADNIQGRGGNDTLEGGGGGDTIYGESGNDTLRGDAGNDTLYGGSENDRLEGGTEDDFLEGQDGDDTLLGGEGDDDFYDYQGANTNEGGGGADFFYYTSYGAGVSTYLGGAGRDLYRLEPVHQNPAFHVADRIGDFQAGPGGDRLGVGNLLFSLTGYVSGDNPFTAGYWSLVAVDADGDGAADDTAFRVDADASGAASSPVTVVNLLNTAPAAITADNINLSNSQNDLAPGYGPTGVGRTVNGTPDNDDLRGTPDDDLVVGGSGRDTLSGRDGDDDLQGGAGGDTLSGERGRDTLAGGDGGDNLNGGEGNDSLLGGDGNDNLDGVTGDDTAEGGAGDDAWNDFYGTDVVNLGAGEDLFRYVSYYTYTSAEGPSVLTGGAGVDTYNLHRYPLNGQGVADVVTDFAAGPGGDTVHLQDVYNGFTGLAAGANPFATGHLRLVAGDADGDGAADDTRLQGDADGTAGGATWVTLLNLLNVAPAAFHRDNFSDQYSVGQEPPGPSPDGLGLAVNGTDAGERLDGTPDGDTLRGFRGDDDLRGRYGDDDLDGGLGRDTLYGGEGDDALAGGNGPDNLQGEGGDDTLLGGAGDDYLEGGEGDDSTAGGDGDDILADYRGADTLDGGAGDDRFVYVSYDSDGRSTLVGGGGGDRYDLSNIGNTTLVADLITDFAVGAGGDVVFLTGYGALSGLAYGSNPFTQGYLRLVAADADGDGAADDTVLQVDRNGTTGGAAFTDLLAFANLAPAAFTAFNFRFGTDPDLLVSPTGTGLTITGGPADDRLRGGVDNDTLSGLGGDDDLGGRFGGDSLLGGDGRDRLDGEDGDDRLDGGAGSDSLLGGAGDDTLLGGAGGDYLEGGEGDDSTAGGDGDDILADYRGADTLDGGAGADFFQYLSYSAGRSVLTGGAGADRFDLHGQIFNDAAAVADLITDFAAGSQGVGQPQEAVNLNSFVFSLQGWDSTTNPFATGFLRLVAVDADGDGAVDDTALQADRNGAAGGAAYTNVLLFSNVAPLFFSAQDFTYSNRLFDPLPATNLAPTAADRTYAVQVGGAFNAFDNTFLSLEALAQDLDGDALTFSLVSGPAAGTLALNANGSFTYTAPAATGTQTFTYRVSDGTATSPTYAASIAVVDNATGFSFQGTALSENNLGGLAGPDTIRGGGGNDTIYGQGGGDTVEGEDGDDNVQGGPGNDSVTGGAGDDSLYGGGDNDTLVGGDGEDLLYVGDTGTDSVLGGAGDDTFQDVSYQVGVSTLTGGAGRDTYDLEGFYPLSNPAGHTADLITDFAVGQDVVAFSNDAQGWFSAAYAPFANPFAGGFLRLVAVGSETVLQGDRTGSGDGAQWVDLLRFAGLAPAAFTAAAFAPGWTPDGANGPAINGTARGERLDGTVNGEAVNALGGDDDVRAGAGGDAVLGGAGRDTVYGQEGRDDLDGGDGDDQLYGEADGDTLRGGAGEDTLSGGAGDDSLLGGTEDDALRGDAGNDTLLGGEGDDTLDDYEGTNAQDGGAGDDLFRNVSYGNGADAITLGAGADTVDLQGYYPLVSPASHTPDTVADFTGEDVIYLRSLSSWFTGWDPNTNPFTGGFLRLFATDLDGDGAADDVAFQGDRTGSGDGAQWQTVLRLLNVSTSVFDRDSFRTDIGTYNEVGYAPNGLGATVNGTPYSDNGGAGRVLHGTPDGDTIRGLARNDQIQGGLGRDRLEGGDGEDNLNGEGGNDTLDGGDGGDTLNGNAGSDSLLGGAGDDVLDGGTEDDTVEGGAGDDTFNDYQGANRLDGGAGEDYFRYVSYAGSGRDTMTGGAGRDTYNLEGFYITSGAYAGTAADLVTDFATGPNGDVVALSGFGTNPFGSFGNPWSFTNYTAGTNPFATGFLRLAAVDADGDGAVDDTALQVDRDGPTSATAGWRDLLHFANLAPGSFSSANFSPRFVLGAGNGAPLGQDDAYRTVEDTPITITPDFGVLANDSDPEGGALTAILVSNPSGGSVALDANGGFVFTPSGGFSGTTSFTYRPNDGSSNGNLATVTITVDPENDAPVADNDAYNVVFNTPLVVSLPAQGVLAGDFDGDGDALTAALATGPSNGTLTLNANGTFTYTPTAGFSGTDSFTYRASDGTTTSNLATVTLTVDNGNDAPVGANDTYNGTEDAALTVPVGTGVLANDADADGDALTAALVAGSVFGGSVVLNANGSFTFTPSANTSGPGAAGFSYRPNDGTDLGNVTTVRLNLAPVNDAPTADNDAYSVNEDATLTVNAANGVLVGDSDVDGNPLTAALATGPANGSLTLNANGSFTYTPNANFSGSDSFTYRASDGTLTSGLATVTITVTPQNDAPVSSNDAYSIGEDGDLQVPAASGVLANDADADGNPLAAVLATGPANGSLTLNANGSFRYVPTANFSGTDSFTYRANDGTANGNTATATITVVASDDAPTGLSLSNTTVAENSAPDTLVGLFGATDPDAGETFTFSLVNDAGGRFRVDGNRLEVNSGAALDFEAATSHTVTARVTDSDGLTFTRDFTIGVSNVNEAPTADAESYSVASGGTLTVSAADGILAGDTDPEGADLDAVLVTGPTKGTLTLDAETGAFTYASNAGSTGTDTFTYRASDGTNTSALATVTINLSAPANAIPVADDDAYNGTEDTPLVVNAANGVLIGDTDANGDPLTATLLTGPAKGAVVLNANGSFTYTPNANTNGADSFTYTVSDGRGGTDTATVALTIAAVNDAPVADDEAGLTTPEDTALAIPVATLLAGDTDPDGDTLTVTAVGGATGGTVSLAGGVVTFTPTANLNGAAGFTYTVSDGNGGTDTGAVSLTVTPVNDAPTAIGISNASVAENSAPDTLVGTLTTTDADAGDTFAYSLVSNPGGLFRLDGNRLEVNGALDFEAAATRTVRVRSTDSAGASTERDVVVSIINVNEAPTADDDGPYSATAGAALVVNAAGGVLAGDADPEGAALTAALVTGPTKGTLTLNANGSFTYTANAGATGGDSFTYRASDGANTSNLATVTLAIGAPANVAPVADDDAYAATEDTPLVVSAANGVLVGDTDGNGDALTASVATGPANGALVLNADGSFTYTPNANFNGSDGFTYTVSDGRGGTDTGAVSITVAALNDAPVADNEGGLTTPEDTPLAIPVATLLDGDTDADGDTLAVTAVGGATGGTVSLSGGVVTFTPTANYSGPASFAYTVSDGNGGTTTGEVVLAVTPVNDAPVANDDAGFAAQSGATITIAAAALLANDTDVDGPGPLSIASVASGTGGTATLLGDGSVRFVADAAFTGTASFTYVLSDGAGGTDAAGVSVAVSAAPPPPPPVVQIVGVSPGSAAEGTAPGAGATYTVTLSRTGDLSGASSVQVALAGTGADPAEAADVAGGFAARTVAFATGEATATLVLSAVPDAAVEGAEGVRVTLASAAGATLGAATTADFAIANDDAPVTPPPAGARYVRGTEGPDLLDLSATPATTRLLIAALGGNDTVRGGAGDDALNGGAGDDNLLGGAGRDALAGGAGADRLLGGAGEDAFVFARGDLARASGGAGPVDTILGFEGAGAAGGDLIAFRGLGAGATISYLRDVGGSPSQQLYRVAYDADGPAGPGGIAGFELLVHMASGSAARLAAGDFVFLGA